MSVVEYFPFETPRDNQRLVLQALEQAVKDGYKTILLEAPVGSGKSPIAIAFSRYLKESHILTPRKGLQDQYRDDFSDTVKIMKGRSAYPCLPRTTPLNPANTDDAENTSIPDSGEDQYKSEYNQVSEAIKKGNRIPTTSTTHDCSDGPCKRDGPRYTSCTLDGDRPCPYDIAMDIAMQHPYVVHNMHSFFFQSNFALRFGPKNLIVIDEAHQLEDITRGFLSTTVHIHDRNTPDLSTLPDNMNGEVVEWVDWFLKQRGFSDFIPQQGQPYGTSLASYMRKKLKTKDLPDDEAQFVEKIDKLMCSNWSPEDFTVSYEHINQHNHYKFVFTPINLKGAPKSLYLNYGEYRLIMSGTIYNKDAYCRGVGLDPDEVLFLRIESTFPLKHRPIYAKQELMTDNSYKGWNGEDSDNYTRMLDNILTVLDKYPDYKGLIHAPSYYDAHRICEDIDKRGNSRLMTHERNDFIGRLNEFYERQDNSVFVSPICQQGVDMKDDRARFQMVLRIPYLNASDAFVKYMIKKNFAWYNYQALILFGQQIGRVVRSEEDFGATYLMDSRFPSFLKRNSKYLPKWLRDAIVY